MTQVDFIISLGLNICCIFKLLKYKIIINLSSNFINFIIINYDITIIGIIA